MKKKTTPEQRKWARQSYDKRVESGARRIWVELDEALAVEAAADKLDSAPLRALANRFSGRKP